MIALFKIGGKVCILGLATVRLNDQAHHDGRLQAIVDDHLRPGTDFAGNAPPSRAASAPEM